MRNEFRTASGFDKQENIFITATPTAEKGSIKRGRKIRWFPRAITEHKGKKKKQPIKKRRFKLSNLTKKME